MSKTAVKTSKDTHKSAAELGTPLAPRAMPCKGEKAACFSAGRPTWAMLIIRSSSPSKSTSCPAPPSSLRDSGPPEHTGCAFHPTTQRKTLLTPASRDLKFYRLDFQQLGPSVHCHDCYMTCGPKEWCGPSFSNATRTMHSTNSSYTCGPTQHLSTQHSAHIR